MVCQASPGNLQQLEEVLFGGGAITHTAVTLAVRLATQGKQGGRLVGLAYADLNNHVLGVTEFTDGDQLSELQVSVVTKIDLQSDLSYVHSRLNVEVFMYGCTGTSSCRNVIRGSKYT